MLYQTGPELYIADWLLHHNHEENKDREIQGLSIIINTIKIITDLPVCTSIQDTQEASAQDAHLQDLKVYIIHDWLCKRENVAPDIQEYWPIRHELAMIDVVAIKGKRIIIPSQFQKQILSQLQKNHVGIKMMRLLAHKYIYTM